MIYFLLLISLTANGILIWYIRKLIKNYIIDSEAVDKFSEMLGQYADSLSSIYKLEEVYGDETVKKAIAQTKFVIEACEEFKGGLGEDSQNQTETEEEPQRPRNEQAVIKLKEGERITQTASSYKRIIVDN